MKEHNIAFVDGQNLHLGITAEGWKLDFKKFRIYLQEKYQVDEAYFFLWFLNEDHQDLYRKLQKSGFILEFREHNAEMLGKKKWNVDVDIVFEIMKTLKDEQDFDNILLVSGDGDYIKVVKYLIQEKALKKILFPNKKFSSLYKAIATDYGANISLPDIRKKLEYKGK